MWEQRLCQERYHTALSGVVLCTCSEDGACRSHTLAPWSPLAFSHENPTARTLPLGTFDNRTMENAIRA